MCNSSDFYFWKPLGMPEIQQKMLSCKGWQAKYVYLISLAKQLPEMPLELQVDSNKITGCEVDTWLAYKIVDDRIYFCAHSKAKITKGIIALILIHIQGNSIDALKKVDFGDLLHAYSLFNNLSASRVNGLSAFVEKIKYICLKY